MKLWASVVAETVKNLPAMRETWVPPLGWENSLEKGLATHSSIPYLDNPMDRGAWGATDHGAAKSQTQLKQLKLSVSCFWGPTGPFSEGKHSVQGRKEKKG